MSDVARWVGVAPTWLGHRPEPLIHERLWAYPLVLGDDARGPRWAGVDAGGRLIAMRDSVPGHEDYVERVHVERREVVLCHDGRVMVRTELDADGRPQCSRYPGRGDEERYRYDGEGRLTGILESRALALSAAGGREETGGPLVVEHDARGPSAIRGQHETVWERVDEAWPDLLRRSAREIAQGLIEAVESCGVAPGTEVFALSLTYVEQGSLHSVHSFGREEERRAWLASGLAASELERKLWYLIAGGGGLDEIERYSIPADSDARLLREACLKQPDNPTGRYCTKSRRCWPDTSGTDWSSRRRTSLRSSPSMMKASRPNTPPSAVNPADRLAAWDARWPAGVSRGEDEADPG